MSTTGLVRRALGDAKECGDAVGFWQLDGTTVLYVIDGLGHGPKAEAAAQAAIASLEPQATKSFQKIFSDADEALRSTRGVAMGVARIDESSGLLTYAGIGNTRIVFGKQRMKSFYSSPGIVGGGYGHLDEEQHRLMDGDMVLMYTDGLTTEINFGAYDTALHANPARLAERILHDASRGTDDAGVLVYRYKKED